MLVNCDFCGTVYDTDRFSNCPNCQAASGKNSAVQHQVNIQNQANQYNTYAQMERDRYITDRERYNADAERFNAEQEYLETQRLKQRIIRERANDAISKGIRLGCSLPFVIVAILIAVAIVVMAYNGLKDEGFFGDTYKPDTSATESIEEVIETPQSVKLNETATLTNYSVICDKFGEVNPYPWNVDDGYKMYEIHLVIQNVSEKEYDFREKITCIADGFQCEERNKPRDVDKTLRSGYIDSGLKVQGSLCFDIPDDAKEVILKVGNYITIKLR